MERLSFVGNDQRSIKSLEILTETRLMKLVASFLFEGNCLVVIYKHKICSDLSDASDTDADSVTGVDSLTHH